LFRLLGRELGVAGELYLRLEEETWSFDDIILEESQSTSGREEPYPYNFPPYERIF
jgi:hypothetical protein